MTSTLKESIHMLIEAMNRNPDPISQITAVFRFQIKEQDSYTVSFGAGEVTLLEEHADADCIITISEKDMVKLLANHLNTTMAYMTGAIKVDGKLTLALKLLEALKAY